MEPTPKNIFRLRMYFSNNLDIETRVTLLENQLVQQQKRLSFLLSQKAAYDDIPDVNSNYFGDYLVLDGAIIRENATIQWLNNCINYCLKNK